jgi:hypothetical protein
VLQSTREQTEQATLNVEAAILRCEAAMAAIQADAADDHEGKLPMAWFELHGVKRRLEDVHQRLLHTQHLLEREAAVRA